ncbi:hypothetical protein K501DRAFT_331963 [Backusella circina FSU 941]|nr:hypothetical protein K501DRAFT_331963 [Backusella circina FSU 941]
MSNKVDFNTHGQELKQAYDAVISEKDDTNWLIYAYDKGTYDLRVQDTGDGGLEELNDEFSDGKVQFAYARVIDPNTELPKFVFIGWCGSGVPELRKVFFNSHLSEVSKFFKNFHVQINARDEADVEPDLIMKRVAESSGANYSVHKESAKPLPRVTPVGSVYKKTEIPDIAAMQRQSMTKENAPTPVGTNYKPVQTTPRKMESRWNQATQQDSGAASVRAERERFEQEVRDREMQQSRAVQQDDRLEQEAAEAAKREREDAERRQMEREAEERVRRDQERQFQEDQERRQQEEYEQRQRQEEEHQRQQEEHQRQQDAADRQRQQDAERQRQQDDEHQRQQDAERQRQQDAERQRQQEEEEAERQAEHQRHLEAERRAQEEEEAERQRQEEEQQALQAQLNQTADRAVHASQSAAAGVAASSPHQGVCAVVMFEYDASEANEMTLVEGEVIQQIDQVDEGWWFGISEDGKKQGLFPANYVEVLEEAAPAAPPAAAPVAPPAPAAPPAPPAPPVVAEEGPKAVALYDYDAGEDNEITFREGETITDIEFVSDDWWQGVSGGRLGLFPANYVELKE